MDGVGRLQDGSRPCPSACQHKSTKTENMASCGRQPQVSPLPPTGVQAVLSTGSGVAKYLACASGPQSESVYHLYQELLRPSLFLKTPAQTTTPAPWQDPAPPSFDDATLSYHLHSHHDLFWSYGRLGSAKHSCCWPAPQVSKSQFCTHVRVT